MKDIVNDIFGEGKKIDQDYIEQLAKETIDNFQYDSEHEKKHDFALVFGGECPWCGSEYKKENTETGIGIYYLFVPQCNCFEKRQSLKIERAKRYSLYVRASIPENYMKSNYSNINQKKCSEETITAIKKVKSYIELKLYSSKGVILFGHVGTGKTHAAVAIMKHLIINEEKRCLFVPMADVKQHILSSSSDYIDELISGYHAILFDDLDKLSVGKASVKNEWTEERMFSLFDGMTRRKRIIIATSNSENIKDLAEKFDKSIISRLVGNCELIKFAGKDYRLSGLRG